jgi:hypothetical protein
MFLPLLPLSFPLTQAHRTNPTSPLLSLPAELRNIIFTYVFYDGTYFFYRPTTGTGPSPRPTWPGLSATCRQLNAETALLPYTLNKFEFPNTWDAEYVVKRLNETVGVRPGGAKVPLKVAVQYGLTSSDYQALGIPGGVPCSGSRGIESILSSCLLFIDCDEGDLLGSDLVIELSWDDNLWRLDTDVFEEARSMYGMDNIK